MNTKNIIIYDFDGTLTPYSLTKFEILEKCGLKDGAFNPKFLEMANEKVKNSGIDLYTAIYEVFFEIIKSSNLELIDKNFCLGADRIDYNSGVLDFLECMQNNGIKNYLLSSGLKVYLENTIVSKFFSKIYATSFNYNSNGEATGIKYLMNDKNKVTAIKDIIKKNGNKPDDCHNIIYIGDGFTDYYAMEYVKNNGGTSIFVYQDEKNSDMKRLKEKDVISFATYADFSPNSELMNYVKSTYM